MGTPMATSQDFINWVCGPKLSPKYLHYLLMCEQDSIRRFAHGTTHQTVYYPEAKAFHVCIPERWYQDAIAAVLGSLDDKIAINDRIVATASQLASTLFMSIEEIAILPIIEVASITMGQSPPGETYNENKEGIPFYQGTRDFGFRHPRKRVWCTAVTRRAFDGDVLVSVRAPVGEINVAKEECGIGRGVAAVRSAKYPHVLLQALAANPSIWLPYEAEGTVFGSINKKQLTQLMITWPSSSKVNELEKQLASLDDRLRQAEEESATLATLRDVLLPQLISGRLRIRDAERIVEDAL